LGISDEAMKALEHYHWPGNVRELENCILRGVVLTKTDRIEEADLPEEVITGGGAAGVQTPRDIEGLKIIKKREKGRVVGEIEKQFVVEALRRNKGNVSRSAGDVGMDRRQFQNLIRKYGILAKDFRGRG